jgi:hypothetical protein
VFFKEAMASARKPEQRAGEARVHYFALTVPAPLNWAFLRELGASPRRY